MFNLIKAFIVWLRTMEFVIALVVLNKLFGIPVYTFMIETVAHHIVDGFHKGLNHKEILKLLLERGYLWTYNPL